MEEESVEYKPKGLIALDYIFPLVFPLHYTLFRNVRFDFPHKISWNFVNFGQGIPEKVRENYFLQVLTTMID